VCIRQLQGVILRTIQGVILRTIQGATLRADESSRAARIVKQRDFLVVGSAAILGAFDDVRLLIEATRSDVADLAPCDELLLAAGQTGADDVNLA
jgi:hypothetical protein